MVVGPTHYTTCNTEWQRCRNPHTVRMTSRQFHRTPQCSAASWGHPSRANRNYLSPKKTRKMEVSRTLRQRPLTGSPINKSSEDSLGKLQAQPGRESAASLFEGHLSALSGVPLLGGFTSAFRRVLGGRLRGRWLVQEEAALEQPAASPARLGFLAAPGDREILSLLLPAMLAVFLDPSMGAIDLGKAPFVSCRTSIWSPR
jgi:hypothetical protein